MRPACPTSCVSSSVALRTPLCISVRLVTSWLTSVSPRTPFITVAQTTISTVIEIITSMRDRPRSPRTSTSFR
jgi:hypothetical protein